MSENPWELHTVLCGKGYPTNGTIGKSLFSIIIVDWETVY